MDKGITQEEAERIAAMIPLEEGDLVSCECGSMHDAKVQGLNGTSSFYMECGDRRISLGSQAT